MKKILFVYESTCVKESIQNIVKQHPDQFQDEYYFSPCKKVFHLNDNCVQLRKFNDKIYSMGYENNSLNPLVLKNINIPNDMFLISKKKCPHTDLDLLFVPQDMDEIISICRDNNCGVLSFAKYLEENNIDFTNGKCLCLSNFDENSLLEKLKEVPSNFQNVFNSVKKHLIENNFSSQFPRNKELLYLRVESRMTREEFSNYFHIPVEDIVYFEKNPSAFKEYLYDLMDYKLSKEGMFIRN